MSLRKGQKGPRLKPQETRMKVYISGWHRFGSVGTLVAYEETADICMIKFDDGETQHYPREVLDVMRGKVPG